MVYSNVPEVLKKMQRQSGDSLHAMACRAGVSYSTAHAWITGKASPNIEKFNAFLHANNFKMRVVNDA